MPYKKDKQVAFQKAQEGVRQAEKAYLEIVLDGSDYGSQLKHLKNEVNEAYEQINVAMAVTQSEHQEQQLRKFRDDLEGIVQSVNDESLQ